LSVYSTKTNKLNYRKNQLRLGISLIVLFSVMLILVGFNFFNIFTILMLGSIGLLFYPLCLFFLIIGILLVANKPLKPSKSITIFSIVWIAIFVLILQLATSKNLDSGFAQYLLTSFKYNLTAGGVIFGALLYPIYFITHKVAAYVILTVALIIISAFLIDRIRLQFISKSTLHVSDKNLVKNEDRIQSNDNFEEEMALDNSYSKPQPTQIDEDIFIQDEDEFEQKSEAKEILGLSKERTINDLNYIVEQANKSSVDEDLENNNISEKSNSKPNIIVHEDNLDINTNRFVFEEKTLNNVKSEAEKAEDEKKKAALEYLNISKGKFQSKSLPKGLDNVKQEPNPENNVQKVQNIAVTNTSAPQINRISSLTEKIQNLGNNNQPETNNKNDLYDPTLTKRQFGNNQDHFVQQITIPDEYKSNFPKKANEVYTGHVNDNIVESEDLRPYQISLNDPLKKTDIQRKYPKPPAVYVKPPLDLLKKYSSSIESDEEYIREKGNLIVNTLKNFKIDTHIINAIKGPTFTRYELQMAPGISVSTINSKTDDLSMVLESKCRLQIPIPGKNAFGIEVPNKKRLTIGLRDILESTAFQSSKSPLTFALGKDISNEPKVSSIDKLVHLLVAGSTGSGKSVCLHTILISLLYKASPEDLKLLLVDPKTVEFSFYNNLPHMLIPNAITDCDKAIQALEWLVNEMERRYKRLNSIGVRNIESYNESTQVRSGSIPKMYYIVMVFDEVGDYMAIKKKEIEEKVMRLAAKSRAAGIHLILTTQRPTVDVITGTIKANLPSRIAFAVNTYQDSKTILDSAGAEMLLSMGDMLFLPKGSNDTERIQCAFVDDKDELRQIVEYIKEHNESEFDEEIEDQMFNQKDGFDPSNGAEDAFDSMMSECVRAVIKAKKCSTSFLQGALGIGYPRANKIILQMEKAGFISANDGTNKRQIFITPQEFEEKFGESFD